MIPFDKIKDNIGIISLAVLIATFTRLYIYYSIFHINIIPFIDLSEIPKYSIDIFVFGVIGFGLIFGFLMVTLQGRIKFGKQNKYSSVGHKLTYAGIMLANGLTCTFMLYRAKGQYSPGGMAWGLSGIAITILSSLILFDTKQREDFSTSKFINIYWPLQFLFLIIFSIQFGFLERLLINKNNRVVFLYDEKKLIQSTENYYPIGSTSNYYFMYNEASDVTTIYDRDKISRFTTFKLKLPPDKK